MSAPAFTPGPWRIAGEHDHEEIELCCVESATHDAIAIVSDQHTDHDDPLPNAHLIASAPALYAALKSLADLYAELRDAELIEDSDMTELKAARAALAQAEGRSS